MAKNKDLTALVPCWDGKLRAVTDGKYGNAYGLAIKPDGTLVVLPEDEFNKLAGIKPDSVNNKEDSQVLVVKEY